MSAPSTPRASLRVEPDLHVCDRCSHSHRYLYRHGDRWLCACGKEMDATDLPGKDRA